MNALNMSVIADQKRRLRLGDGSKSTLPPGTYQGVVVAVEPVETRYGRPMAKATLKSLESADEGLIATTIVHGATRARLERLQAAAHEVEFRVYEHRSSEGRYELRVDAEGIRLSPSPTTYPPPLPAMGHVVQLVSQEYTKGFCCRGTVKAKREPVDWHELLRTMASCGDPALLGIPVFGSTYTFTSELFTHASCSDFGKRAGSLARYKGPVHSPALTFDIDRRDSGNRPCPQQAHDDAVKLLVALLEAGVPDELILVFFSGSKGFHIQIPSMLAAAFPSASFVKTAGLFCTDLACRAGVEIDQSMYRVLQPLRCPNSRHEATGLYKVHLSIDELLELPFDGIRKLATKPRPFEMPAFVCETVPWLADLWRECEPPAVASTVAKTIQSDHVRGGGICRATWEFLIHGAPVGERANALFKAAADLAGFGSVEALTKALLERPSRLIGMPPAEADGHISNGIARAVGERSPWSWQR